MRRQRDFPREIHLGDDVWRVVFKRAIPPEDDDHPANPTLGLTDPSTHTISIAMGQTAFERLRTFVHELFHAIEYSYNIRISHWLIYRLEVPVAWFLWNNACFVRWENPAAEDGDGAGD